jgi:hypothetical protein
MARHKNTGMPMGSMKKAGGGVQTSADTARKLATEMGGMKKGGKPKASGLAVMIAIGSPMKGMKKPVKKAMGGGMASMIPAPDGPPTGSAPSGRSAFDNSNLIDAYNATRGNLIMPSGLGAASAGKEAAKARMKAAAEDRAYKNKLIKSVSRSEGAGSIGGMPISIPPKGQPMDRQREQMMQGIKGAGQGESPMGGNPLRGPRAAGSPAFQQTAMQLLQPGQPMAMKKGGDAMKPVKKAQGGAGKVRKGMMTPEGKIIHAMNKIRGK